jgi:hypothetical protein
MPVGRPVTAHRGVNDVHDPMRIELDDVALAESLTHALSAYHADLVHVDGRAEILVELIDGNPERRVTETLSTIDAWLARTGTDSVRVHLDGHVYTLAARPEA